MSDLSTLTNQLVSPPKGILASDESVPSLTKKFDLLHLASTKETRQAWRELIITTPGIEQYLSGIILHDETIRQSDSVGIPFSESLRKRGILLGIKVDQGIKDFKTQGLDHLPERLLEYKSMGASFTKWRAVYPISANSPSQDSLYENAKTLAQYAKQVQDSGLVPIIEPEVLMDGDHSQPICEEVTGRVLESVFTQLRSLHVDLEGLILKTHMIIAGTTHQNPSDPESVARATLRCLTQYVPDSVGGIVFLSGGQTALQTLSNLNAIARAGSGLPWKMTFSYLRAIQDDALHAWAGEAKNTGLAQQILLDHLSNVSLASTGEYAA